MMSGKMKQSVLVRVNVSIAVIIICVIAMLAYSNIKAIRTIRDKAEKTYQSMGEYYANDLKANLNSIAEYLLRISDTSEYYNVAYSGKNSELINALAKQKLYNRLNDDILVYRPADYFFTYRKADSTIMLVASAQKSAKTPNWEIKDQLALLMIDGFLSLIHISSSRFIPFNMAFLPNFFLISSIAFCMLFSRSKAAFSFSCFFCSSP